jgi:hypothetical protein
MAITVRDIQGTPYLTNHIVGYAKEQKFVADQLAPVMEVDSEEGTYYVIPFDAHRRAEATGQGEGSPAKESTPPIETGTFTTQRHAHKSVLTDRKRDIAMKSPEGLKGIVNLYAEHPSSIVLLAREKALVAAMDNLSNYFSASHYTSVTGGDRWDAFATSNPQKNVISFARVIHGNSGIRRGQLTLAIGSQVLDTLQQHPHVQDKIKAVQKVNPDDIGLPELAKYFGVKDVVVGEEIEITSKVGLAKTSAYLWGKNAYLLHVDPMPNSQVPTAGSFCTCSTLGRQIPRVRTTRRDDPESTLFIAEAQFGIALGAPTGEGLRTAARLATVIS